MSITSPGHESPTGWSYFFGAERYATGSAHGGSYVGRLRSTAGFADSRIEQGSITPVGGSQQLSFWIRPVTVLGSEAVEIRVDRGNGVFFLVDEITPTVGVWSQWVSGELESLGATWRVRVDGQVPGFGVNEWWVDDWVLEPYGMARRRTIKDAVITALADLTIANGYSVDVGDIVDGDVPDRMVNSKPGIAVRYITQRNRFGDGDGPSPFQAVLGGVAAQLSLELRFHGEVSFDQLDDMAADAEQLLQVRTDSNFLGLGYVCDVRTMVTEPLDDRDSRLTGDQYLWHSQVLIDFTYDRNSP